jgi:light-independent protochlorophyllide reductase subunit B
MMGLEEHLLAMFREDFEFHDEAAPSHLGHGTAKWEESRDTPQPVHAEATAAPASSIVWAVDAEKELTKIPFFVRGKARRNTERFAAEHGVATVTLETLYDAKAHYSR